MSESTPRLSYKFQRLREVIRDAIASGELPNKLPGERELARRFRVNAKTISKALTDLTSEGLLVRQVGRGTFVASQANEDRVLGARRRYVWLTTTQPEPSFLEVMFNMARSRLQTQGHEISLQVVEPDEAGELPERCLSIGHLKGLAGVLIFSSMPSQALLADLSRRHMAVVLCNTHSASIKTNSVAPDFAQGAFELTEHLIQLGHRKIQLLLDRRADYAAAQAQRGYQTAMCRHRLSPLALVRCSPTELGEVMVGPDTEPTAVVCVGGRLARAIRQYVGSTGRTIPQHLSLTAIAQPGQLTLQQDSTTSYDIFPDRMLDWALQLLFDHAPGFLPRMVVVPGVFSDRGSTARYGETPMPLQDTPHVIL